MKKILYTLFLVSLVFCLFSCRAQADPEAEQGAQAPKFRHDGVLRVLDSAGNLKATFRIEIATTEMELRQGLKFRDSMEDDQGMLFVFDGSEPRGFWMEDTYMPLDMLFIDYENTIFQIEENTEPFSTELIDAEGFNLYTLEVKAGTCAKHKITVGDKIEWERVSSPSSH